MKKYNKLKNNKQLKRELELTTENHIQGPLGLHTDSKDSSQESNPEGLP